MATARNQPTYDFLSGAPSDAPQQSMRQTLRQSQTARPDQGNEELRAQIKTLQYELASIKQERELSVLQHENELRDAQNKAEADFRRMQAAESSGKSATTRYDALARELQEVQSQTTNEKLELERKIRTVSGQRATLEEELEEAQEQLSTLERETARKESEQESRYAALQHSFDQLRSELETKATAVQTTQQKLSQREAEYGQLEAEALQLKSQSGDAEAVEILKRDLSEQVAHIRKLESTNRTQLAELKDFRATRKSIEVVEEEKRSLETKLRLMNDLRTELAEVRLRNEALEAEKNAWAAYLESQSSEGGQLQFDSPEDLARAFMRERLEKASAIERLGAVQPELTVKEDNIRALEDQKSQLQAELAKLKAAGGGSSSDSKAKARLERQKNLAVKESEYLRAQLKALDAEESEMNPERYSEEQSKRIQELESLAEEYRKQVETLHVDLTKLEAQPAGAPTTGTKRPLEDASDERMGELLRKNRQLQASYTTLQTRSSVLESELKAKSSQLDALKTSSRTRILEFKNNPTSTATAIKQRTLDTPKAENDALMAQLAGKLPTAGTDAHNNTLVPRASLTKLELALAEKDATIADCEKTLARLRKIFGAKGYEFIEAVYSLLGWRLAFQPNGKVKASCMYYRPDGKGAAAAAAAAAADEDAAIQEHFIEFDGENGTMKVSGGLQSAFAREISGLTEFWVDGKGQVPCFLAAMTLEFFEKYGDVGVQGRR